LGLIIIEHLPNLAAAYFFRWAGKNKCYWASTNYPSRKHTVI